MKTVLAPGAPWPKFDQPVEHPSTQFEHKQKPVRIIKPKVKRTPVRKELKNNLDPLAAAREQIASGEAKSKHSHAARNLEEFLKPKQIFYFSKARSAK